MTHLGVALQECDICAGRGTIRLPIIQRVIRTMDALKPISPNVGYREYRCPECQDPLPEDKIEILYAEHVIMREEDRFVDHIKKSLAMQLADYLYQENCIDYEIRDDSFHGFDVYRIRARVGVLTTHQVKSFEQRVKERQLEMAQALVTSTLNQVDNWRSLYNDPVIEKSTVNRILYQCLDILRRGQTWHQK